MSQPLPMLPIKGRGAAINPASRFEKLDIAYDPGESGPPGATIFYRDHSRSIIAHNDSPDVGFDASVNPYRGCEHGCVYCFARPTHEYFDLSLGLDFETKIFVKEDAPRLLRQELSARSWRPQVLGFSGVTDPYQPIERKLRITRRCLEVIAEFRNPVCMITKNHLITRDADLLADLARRRAAKALISITTLDPELASSLEPRASHPRDRLAAIRELSAAGVPVGVLVAPIIPALTDSQTPAILEAARDAGATSAGFVPLRLPFGLKELFSDWLTRHFPERRDKVLNRVRAMRGGKLNDSSFGSRMRGEGIFAEQIRAMFKLSCRKLGLNRDLFELTTDAFRPGAEATLFDG